MFDTICRDCEAVAARSYHRVLGVGFVDDAATRQAVFSFGCAGLAQVLYSLRRWTTFGFLERLSISRHFLGSRYGVRRQYF